jgi:hypothetical protein
MAPLSSCNSSVQVWRVQHNELFLHETVMVIIRIGSDDGLTWSHNWVMSDVIQCYIWNKTNYHNFIRCTFGFIPSGNAWRWSNVVWHVSGVWRGLRSPKTSDKMQRWWGNDAVRSASLKWISVIKCGPVLLKELLRLVNIIVSALTRMKIFSLIRGWVLLRYWWQAVFMLLWAFYPERLE